MNRQHSINNEMNATPTTPTVAADTRPAKRARGRPKKTNHVQTDASSADRRSITPLFLNNHANDSVPNTSTPRDLNELDLATKVLWRKVRQRTALAYEPVFAHWKVLNLLNFCIHIFLLTLCVILYFVNCRLSVMQIFIDLIRLIENSHILWALLKLSLLFLKTLCLSIHILNMYQLVQTSERKST